MNAEELAKSWIDCGEPKCKECVANRALLVAIEALEQMQAEYNGGQTNYEIAREALARIRGNETGA